MIIIAGNVNRRFKHLSLLATLFLLVGFLLLATTVPVKAVEPKTDSNTKEDGKGKTYKENDIVIMPEENLVLYAKWEDIEDDEPPQDDVNKGALFEEGSALNTARTWPLVANLPDGKTILFGGIGSGFVSLDTAEIFNPLTEEFEVINMLHPYAASNFVRLNDGRYIISGGSTNSGVPRFSFTQVYDPVSNNFTRIGDTVRFRSGGGGTALSDGNVFIAGAWWTHNDAHTYGELLKLNDKTFSQTAALNLPRSHNIVLPTQDGRAVIFGGRRHTGGLLENPPVEIYDPATNSISILQDELIPDETGWHVRLRDSSQRTNHEQLLGNGKYLYLADNPDKKEYLLFTFDPETFLFEALRQINLPSKEQFSLIDQPMINHNQGLAYLIGTEVESSNSQVIRLITIDLQTGAVYISNNSHSIDYYIDRAAITLLEDGRILVAGGDMGTNFTQLDKTFFITPLHEEQIPVPPIDEPGDEPGEPGGEDFLTWPYQEEVRPDKVWSIKFSKVPATETVDNETIYVMDSHGDVFTVTLESAGNVVRVIPAENYRLGETYTLHILTGITSQTGQNLSTPVKMDFTITADLSTDPDLPDPDTPVEGDLSFGLDFGVPFEDTRPLTVDTNSDFGIRTQTLTSEQPVFQHEGVTLEIASLAPEDTEVQLVVTKMLAPQPIEGAEVEAYKFSTNQPADTGLYEIRIPYTPGHSLIGAGYYNEATSKWEPVVFYVDESAGQVVITTDHLSTYASIVGEKTRYARIQSDLFEAYNHPTQFGLHHREVVDELLQNNMTPGTKAYNLGKSVIDDWLKATGIVLELEGVAYSSEYLSSLSDIFTNVGTALALVQLAVDYKRGDERAMAVNAFNTAQGLAIGKWGTKALKVSMIGVTAIDYSLTKLREELITGREELWYKAYEIYYNQESGVKRSGVDWYNRLKDIQDHAKTPEQFNRMLGNELDRYTWRFWLEPWETQVYYQGEAQKGGWTGGAGLSDNLQKEISDSYKSILLKESLEPVFRRLERENEFEQFKEYRADLQAAMDELNKIITLEIREVVDESVRPAYASYLVQLGPLSSDADPMQWTGRMNENGYARATFTVLGHMDAGAPHEIRLFEDLDALRSNRPALTREFQIGSDLTSQVLIETEGADEDEETVISSGSFTSADGRVTINYTLRGATLSSSTDENEVEEYRAVLYSDESWRRQDIDIYKDKRHYTGQIGDSTYSLQLSGSITVNRCWSASQEYRPSSNANSRTIIALSVNNLTGGYAHEEEVIVFNPVWESQNSQFSISVPITDVDDKGFIPSGTFSITYRGFTNQTSVAGEFERVPPQASIPIDQRVPVLIPHVCARCPAGYTITTPKGDVYVNGILGNKTMQGGYYNIHRKGETLLLRAEPLEGNTFSHWSVSYDNAQTQYRVDENPFRFTIPDTSIVNIRATYNIAELGN